MSETPDVTPANEWTVPYQDKLEQVIDARIGKNGESPSTETESDPAPNDDEVQEQNDVVEAEESDTDQSDS